MAWRLTGQLIESCSCNMFCPCWFTVQELMIMDQVDTISITVADAGRVESRLLRDPQGQGFTLRGGGFVSGLGMEHVDLAPSGSRWTDPDLRRFETKSGARGEFSWSA